MSEYADILEKLMDYVNQDDGYYPGWCRAEIYKRHRDGLRILKMYHKRDAEYYLMDAAQRAADAQRDDDGKALEALEALDVDALQEMGVDVDELSDDDVWSLQEQRGRAGCPFLGVCDVFSDFDDEND